MQKEFVIQNFKRFRPYLVANAPLERLYTGVMWAEGPVYFADLGVLLCSAMCLAKRFTVTSKGRPTGSGNLPATQTATPATAKDGF